MSALLTETRRLLANRPRAMTYKVIQRETNEKVTVKWLDGFANDRIKFPEIAKVEILFDYLSGKVLAEILADR